MVPSDASKRFKRFDLAAWIAGVPAQLHHALPFALRIGEVAETFMRARHERVVLMAWSTSGLAQSWSTQQQELIAQVKRCNDGWSESIKHQMYELFQKACPETAAAEYWYTNSERPVRYGGPSGFWRGSADANRSATWTDLQPTVIQIDGDVGLIYYSVAWTVEPKAGEARRSSTRRLTVFRRVDGRWLMAGGSIAPASGAPSNTR